jgi:GTP cyclohydrolase I
MCQAGTSMTRNDNAVARGDGLNILRRRKTVQVCAFDMLDALHVPRNEHTRQTPNRMAKMWEELTKGYRPMDFNFTTFSRGDNDEMVLVRDIPFYSLCSHHTLPFFGTASVAYIPSKLLCGLSKIPRVVHHFAAKLQVQEILTTEVTNFLQTRLKPLGVATFITARHMCCEMRGIRSHGQEMVTSSLRGVFRTKAAARAELMTIVYNGGKA